MDKKCLLIKLYLCAVNNFKNQAEGAVNEICNGLDMARKEKAN